MKRSLLLLVFATSILALFCHGFIWNNALKDDDAYCVDGVQWGGNGGASAHTIAATLFFIEVAMIVGLCIYYGVVIQKNKKKPIKTAEELRSWRYVETAGNLTLVTAYCIVLFFSGYIVSVMGNHASTSLLKIYGCSADFSYDYMWLPWVGVGSILLTAYFAHKMIPEKTKNVRERAWNYDATDTVTGSAFSVRKINKVALTITIVLSVATMACLWVGFGVYHHNISRSEDGEDLLCNCVGAVNQTLCNEARVALFDTLQGVGGAAWWLLGAAAVVTGFMVITILYSKIGARRSWITKPNVRNFCITLTAAALSINGYAVGSAGGAPTLQLHDLCCPGIFFCSKYPTNTPQRARFV